MAVCLATACLLAACGAPSAADLDSAEIASDEGGVAAEVGGVLLRDVSLDEPADGRYEAGDAARLRVVLINSTPEPDALTSVESAVASSARLLVDRDCDGEPEGVGTIPLPPEPPVRTPSATVPDGPEVYYRVDLLLEESLRSGQSIEVEFTFSNAGSTTLQVPVELTGTPADDAACEPADG
jgi:hypothetical protein